MRKYDTYINEYQANTWQSASKNTEAEKEEEKRSVKRRQEGDNLVPVSHDPLLQKVAFSRRVLSVVMGTPTKR
jgi:hypothetical protein